MERVIFRARFLAPIFTEAPVKIVEKWAKHTKKARPKTKARLQEKVRTPHDFEAKIARPTLKTIDTWVRRGKYRDHQTIMIRSRERLERVAKKRYFNRRQRAFRKENFEANVDLGKKRYAESWVKCNGPLQGDESAGIKGLVWFGVKALDGEPTLRNFLKKGVDKIIVPNAFGISIIPSQAGRGQFRRALRQRLLQLGRDCLNLINSKYEDETIHRANEELNQLVEQYRSPEIAQFSPDGESHIDFIVCQLERSDLLATIVGCIPPMVYRGNRPTIVMERLNPINPDEMIKQLGLEIQVSLI